LLVFALVGISLFGVVACSDGNPDTKAPPAETDALLAIEPMPDGWFVESASIAKYDPGPITNVLFAPDGRVAPKGPMLLVGETATDDRMALGDARGRPVPGLGDAPIGGTLAHFGDFTVVNWPLYLDGYESPFVVSRGLSDTEVIDIAHAVSFDPRPSVAADALPSGWSRVASAPRLPRQRLQAPEHIRVVNTDGTVSVDVLAYRLEEPGSATIDSIVAELQSAAGYSISAAREVGTKTVFAFAHGTSSVVDLLARSMRPVTTEQRNAFQREAFETPPSALCREPLRDSATIDATYGTVRIVIVVPRANSTSGAVCTARVVLGEALEPVSSGYRLPGDGSIVVGTDPDTTIAVSEDASSGDDHWCLVGGTVPSGAARIVVETAGEEAVEARIVDIAGDASHRYYGAYLAHLSPPLCDTTVIAYAADGRELARVAH
jgi:hypothetical protein